MPESKKYLLRSVTLFICFIPFLSLGQLPQSDTPYFKRKISDRLEFFFSEDYQAHSLQLHKYIQAIDQELKRVFPFSPYYKKNSIIFVSSRKQISNGLAFTSPLPSILIYSTPAKLMDSFSIFDWKLDALLHEMTHLYQINSQTKYSYWLSYLLPTNSWLVYPNIYIHNLLLEGNSVLHESIYGSGGRLFSGLARALVFSQIKSGITFKRLINYYNDSFSGLEKYLHGGYFYAYLLSKYSLKDINKFFYYNSKNTFLPIGIYGANKSFKKSLKTNFRSEIENYKKYYKSQARKQKNSKGVFLFNSHVNSNLNSDKDKIFFLITDLKSPPSLIILDKKTKKFTMTKKDLPLGKVFLIDNNYYSANTNWTSTMTEKFTLFKEGYQPLKKYNSQYVMDIIQDLAVGLDTRQSLNQLRLLVNGKFYDTTHSSAIMDQKKNIYYFKNKNQKRILYKNKQPLWGYQGYYGFPIEADETGVYFIAATKRGSGLFLYADDRVFRLSQSDTIVNARKINEKKFLVTEINSKNFSYKIISTSKKKEIPFIYKYSFKKKQLKPSKIKLKNQSSDPYSQISNLRFKQSSFLVYFSKSKLDKLNINAIGSLSLLDPMQYNQIQLSGSMGKEKYTYSLSYLNKKHRLSFEIISSYKKDILFSQSDKDAINTLMYLRFLKEEDVYERLNINENEPIIFSKKKEVHYQDRTLNFKFKYPLHRTPNWKFSFVQLATLGQKKFENKKNWQNFYLHSGGLNFKYIKKYPLAFSYYKKIDVSAIYEAIHIKQDQSDYKTYLTSGGNFSFTNLISKKYERYFSVYGALRRNSWDRKPRQIFKKSAAYSVLNFHSFKQTVQNLDLIDTNIQHVFNQALNHVHIPLSLTRWSLIIGSSFARIQDQELFQKDQHYFLHNYVAGKFKLLINYKSKANLFLSIGHINRWINQDRVSESNKQKFHIGAYLNAEL